METPVSLPITLRASRLRMARLLVISALFVAGGLWVATDTPVAGYFISGFFGLCLLVFAVHLLPNSSYLRLTTEGFTIRTLFRSDTFHWGDLGAFTVSRIARRPAVLWNFAPGYGASVTGRALAVTLTGAEAALPDTYGMQAEELARLMNDLRAQNG